METEKRKPKKPNKRLKNKMKLKPIEKKMEKKVVVKLMDTQHKKNTHNEEKSTIKDQNSEKNPQETNEMPQLFKLFALKNREKFGAAKIDSVIGKIMAIKKISVKEHIEEIKKQVDWANSLPEEEVKEKLKELEKKIKLPEQKKEKKENTLPEPKKKPVITRFAPNPNAQLHFGHARIAILSYEFVKKYGGKFILRFDDTDAKIKTPLEKYDSFLKDLEWLGIKVDKVEYASKRLKIYEEYAEKLIKMGKAYVCTCKREDWQELKRKKTPCPCRNLSPEEHARRFEKMKKHQFKEGESALILKTDLNHPDPSIRDYVIMKIVDNPKHQVKSHLWPTYNFQSAIDDHLMGITLIIRGQEHDQNTEKQKYIFSYFNWEFPEVYIVGRVALENAILSKSKIRKLIEQNAFLGWDDPRLATLAGLRRRGILNSTIRKIILEIGLKTSDTTVSWKKVIAENKKNLANCPEIRGIIDPIKVLVDGEEFWIENGHYKKGTILRLKLLKNIEIIRESPLVGITTNKSTKKIKNWLKQGILSKLWVISQDKIEEKKILLEKIPPVGDIVRIENKFYVIHDKNGIFIYVHE